MTAGRPNDHPAAGSSGSGGLPAVRASDPLALLDEVPLTEDEAGYVEAARAANTLRGYRSDWREFAGWCADHGCVPVPAAAATISAYLSDWPGLGRRLAP